MKPLIIEVREEVIHRSGVSAQTNRPYDLHLQTAYLHTENEYPERCDLRLEDGTVLTPGKYLVGAGAVRFDKMTSKFVLAPARGLLPLTDAIAALQQIQRSEPRAPVAAQAA